MLCACVHTRVHICCVCVCVCVCVRTHVCVHALPCIIAPHLNAHMSKVMPTECVGAVTAARWAPGAHQISSKCTCQPPAPQGCTSTTQQMTT
mmetsp:Transcript_18780/g.40399  ORF Transcript_18780/g.40399 Transcript_18780/m.40399 type:complete len:92 (-) Transcript_18780:92-367(-)